MKEMLVSICAAAILTAVYKAFAPMDRFGAQLKLLVACFFAVSVIGAVSGTSAVADIAEIAATDTSYNDYSVQFGQLTAEETANNLRAAVSAQLAEEGIVPEKIYVDVNIPDSGSISISEIKLVFGQTDYALYAQRAVVLTRKITGTKIKVTAELTPQSKKEREAQ